MMRRNTIQRSVVRQTVCRLDHPSADSVYQEIIRDYPDIGLSTVYRNINVLVEDGQLRRLAIPGQVDRFDGNAAAHDHFLCNACSRLYDVGHVMPGGIDIDAVDGHKIGDYSIMLYGRCKNCIKEHDHG